MPYIDDAAVIQKWKAVLKTTVKAGNKVSPLVDGLDTFEAMYQAILTATGPSHYIYLLGWSLDGKIGLNRSQLKKKTEPPEETSITVLFEKAAKQRVQVRTMLWSSPLGDWNKNGPMVKFINTLTVGAAILDSRTLHEMAGSHHQKVLIVRGNKGLIAFCGGVDIHPDRVQEVDVVEPPPEYLGPYEAAAKGSPYNDVHCRIEGPAANSLVDVFIQRWDEHPASEKYNKEKGDLIGRADRKVAGGAKGDQFVSIVRTFNRVSGNFIVSSAGVIGKRSVCILEHSIRSTMISLIRAATSFIYLEDQYMISLEAAVELRNALKHLQHVTILTTASEISDLPRRWQLRTEFINILMQGDRAQDKVRIFYKTTRGSGLDRPAEFGPQTYIHSKAWIFDDQVAVVASANCNKRGWESDSEVAAVIFDKKENKETTKYSFAQKLRIALWKKHLGFTDDRKVWHGIDHADEWLVKAKDPKSGVRLYNESAGKDTGLTSKLSKDLIDPGSEKYSRCSLDSSPMLQYKDGPIIENGGNFGGAGASGEF